jgi:hypothetical protein
MKKSLDENAANRKKIINQIEKAMSEFSQEQAAIRVDKERARVRLRN